MPCSLDPLPEETLAGFLLRLSHRNEQPPQRIAATSGLLAAIGSAGAILPARLLLDLTPAATQALARNWQLTPEETTRLTLRSAAPHYPPLHSPYLGKNRTASDMVSDGLVLIRSSRYCPQCLAGDGSAMQDEHGGAWQLSWRLPFVSVCLQHNRVLESRCPYCDQLAHSVGQFIENGRWRPGRLVPSPHTILHPAQCRTPRPTSRQEKPLPCTGRLDSRTPAAQQPPADFIEFQTRLLSLSREAAPTTSMAAPASLSEYLIDLRLLILLIAATWPAARPLAPGFAHAAAIDDHLHHQLAHIDRRGFATTFPDDVNTCTALLLFADTLTRSPRPDNLLQELNPLLPARLRPRAAHLVPFASTGFRSALSRLPEFLRTRRGRASTFPQPTNRTGDFEPRNVPQQLPVHWLTELHGLAAARTLHLHRDAAIRLVQTVHDTSRLQAAHFLDLPPAQASSAGVIITSWLRDSGKAPEYIQAITRIADRLTTEPLIDYHQRREALREWTLPDADWDAIATALGRTPSRGRTEIIGTSEGHLAATVYVWAQVTSTEPRLHPAIQRSSGRSTALRHVWVMTNGRTHWLGELRTALDHYARETIARTDCATTSPQIEKATRGLVTDIETK
jgi:hypothetical protein